MGRAPLISLHPIEKSGLFMNGYNLFGAVAPLISLVTFTCFGHLSKSFFLSVFTVESDMVFVVVVVVFCRDLL